MRVGIKLTVQASWIGEALDKAPFFAGWTPSVRGKFIEAAELWRYSKGERVGEMFDPCPGLHLVVGGSLLNYRSSPSGRYSLNAVMWPGDVIGLAPMIDGGVRPETAEARTDSLLLFFPKAVVEIAMADNVCLRAMSRALAFRWRVAMEAAYLRSFDTARCQIAKLLAYLPRRTSLVMSFGPPGTQAWIDPAPVDVTQGELAAMLGMARQTVNRVLGEFQRRGIVVRDGEAIRVISFRGLLSVMEEDEPLPPDWRAEILSWDELSKPATPDMPPLPQGR